MPVAYMDDDDARPRPDGDGPVAPGPDNRPGSQPLDDLKDWAAKVVRGEASATSGGEPAFNFTDNRKVDPVTGKVRQPVEGKSATELTDEEVNARLSGMGFPTGPAPADPMRAGGAANSAAGGAAKAAGAPAGGAAGDDSPALAAAKAEAAKNLDSYQRSQADYINLRNRTTRQISEARANGREDVIRALLPVLDQLERARSHDELTGPMVAIAQQLDDALAKQGFTRFGAVGDAFDPARHEALMHRTSADVPGEQVETVIDPGYLNGEKVMRPAKVGVVGPE